MSYLAASNAPVSRAIIEKETNFAHSTVHDSINRLLKLGLVWASGRRGNEILYNEKYDLTERGLWIALRESWDSLGDKIDFIALKYGASFKNFPFLNAWKSYVETGRREDAVNFLRYFLVTIDPESASKGDEVALMALVLRPNNTLFNDKTLAKFNKLAVTDKNVAARIIEMARAMFPERFDEHSRR